MELLQIKMTVSTEEIYKDILLLFIFFGNDFIPPIKSIQIDEYNIDILFSAYVEIINTNK